MQDGFLFNDEDVKQRGTGCDVLCADDKRLKFKWTWGIFNEGKPSQRSEAKLENGWSLETIFWNRCYGARVSCYGNSVGNYKVTPGENFYSKKFYKENLPLLTRIDAQLKAEELFEELGKDIVRQCNQ